MTISGKKILVTGATGYVGTLFLNRLLKGIEVHGCQGSAEGTASQFQDSPPKSTGSKVSEEEVIVALDIKEIPIERRNPGVIYEVGDVRSEAIGEMIKKHEIDTVVHLASIVTPGKNSNRELEYSVDVLGTKNVLEACVEHGVSQIVVTSSGAAYGYYPDNPQWITERVQIRGNEEFAYSYHKRLVEEMLATYRESHPQLKQTIFRVGTILGASVKNQITDLFEKKVLLGIKGSDSPFVFIWDEDVAEALYQAVMFEKKGIYNLAGSGKLTIHELGNLLNKRVIFFPPAVLKHSLSVLKKLRLTQYGPEQINFLRYRPVLDNRKLREEFGFNPTYTSEEVFHLFLKGRGYKSNDSRITPQKDQVKGHVQTKG
ncbi:MULTISPECIES: SDR family oxidoreductase [Bacillaceae]|uniref:SDR family oxidoreductase n=1 Tax=Evansella alkalicola TaxID=745819 RepID=A0ABS6JXM2_9BACI|nr:MULTISPECIES: SDR family oxidoreductase [Bacillaceae]MBU9723335.1 SDR family oxidoreductase [Bacillus alkalicola]